MKQDIRDKEAYRSANVSSSLTQNSKLGKSGTNLNSGIKITKKVTHKLTGKIGDSERKQLNRGLKLDSDEEISPVNSMNADSAQMYNSAQSKGMSGPKKQLQPS